MTFRAVLGSSSVLLLPLRCLLGGLWGPFMGFSLHLGSPPPPSASLSPERAEDSDALTAVSSALEGSPMDTSSLGSGPPEEGGEGGSAAPQGPPGTPQGPPPAPPGPPDAAHPTDDR